MAKVEIARKVHYCTACDGTINPGDKFVLKTSTGFMWQTLCLPCAGLMRKVCAWCQADMGEIEGKGETGTTHGICPACQVKYFPELYPGRMH